MQLRRRRKGQELAAGRPQRRALAPRLLAQASLDVAACRAPRLIQDLGEIARATVLLVQRTA